MEWFNYLLKVSACSAFFFAFYLLVLRKLTFFKINRFYLLFALLLSFVIPIFQFTIEREVEKDSIIESPILLQDENLTEQFSLGQITPPAASLPVEQNFNWIRLLPLMYSVVVIALLGLAAWRLFQLLKHAKQNTQEINGLKLVHKSIGFTNCSFFNYVFIDENSLTANELQVLLKHEEVHAKQYHSADKIILIIVKAVLWFNPIVYIYDKTLEQIHEFEADEVTSQNFGTTSYANLLLRLAVVKSDMPLLHNFVKSPIKERIKMLFNSKSKHMKKLLYLLALPIGVGLLWSFTVDVVEVPRAFEPNEVQMNNTLLSVEANPLWGKTIEGKVKSILQTEVGEILNFKYGETKIEIFNHAKGKVKVGDELLITISGTVNDITVKDANGKIIKRLEKPCYGMSMMKTKQGEILYQSKDLKKKLITKTYTTNNKGITVEQFRINTLSGKAFSVKIINGNKQNAMIWIYVNDKLYSETEAARFDQAFIAKLPLKRGYSVATDFNIPTIGNEKNAYVFWFGNEPKLSDYTAKNRMYWQKYNGKILSGEIIDFSFDNNKNLNGFLVQTTSGDKVMANVEIRFTKEINAMIAKGDKVTLKIYNANYWKDTEYPVLTSYKISKGGKLLFDKWPKVAINSKHKNIHSIFITKEGISKELNYTAGDSIKTNTKTSEISLYGNASFTTNDVVFKGQSINYNQQKQTLMVRNDASVFNKLSKNFAKADSIFMNLSTQKGIFYDKAVYKFKD